MDKKIWIIKIESGPYSSSSFFEGTEEAAEEQRKLKALWNKSASKKRLANDEEIKTKIIDKNIIF